MRHLDHPDLTAHQVILLVVLSWDAGRDFEHVARHVRQYFNVSRPLVMAILVFSGD